MHACRAPAARALVALALLSLRPAGAAAEWQHDAPLAPAVARAAAERRLVLVRLGRPGCARCRRLARALAARPSELAGHLRLDYDPRAGEGRDVAERYNVIAEPTLLVLGGDGVELGRLVGNVRPETVARVADRLRRGEGTVEQLERDLARRPGDLELRLRLGTIYARRGFRRAEPLLRRVAAEDARALRRLAPRALLVLGRDLLLLSLGDAPEAERTLRAIGERFPRSPEARRALAPLAQALLRQGKVAEAAALPSR